MLAILALSAIFGVGMVSEVLGGFEIPEEDISDADASNDEVAPIEPSGFLPTEANFVDSVAHIALTDEADVFDGEPGGDTVIGGGGDDDLRGNNGEDWLNGGDGDDTLMGGAGDDALSGGGGDDYILGADNKDAVSGGAGDDTIAMGDGNDIYDGVGAEELGLEDSGDDLVRGGAGDDMLRDYLGSDTLMGGLGQDTVMGTHPDQLDPNSDLLKGGYGEDVLVGDNGDTLEGGGGVDQFVADITNLDDESAAVVISDLDAASETITFSASDFGPDAVIEWEAVYDADMETITILLSGSHTVDGTVEELNQEPALVLENMTADAVGHLNVTLDLAA